MKPVRSRKTWIFIFLLVALSLVVLAAPLASSLPDGLEKFLQSLGFGEPPNPDPLLKSPMMDYNFPLLEKGTLSTIVAGAIGVLICFAVPFIFYFLRKK